MTIKVQSLHIYKNKAYGGREKSNILAKETDHFYLINPSSWGAQPKKNVRLDKGDPEDKMYRGAKNSTEKIALYLCPDVQALNLIRYRGEISKIQRLVEKTGAIL